VLKLELLRALIVDPDQLTRREIARFLIGHRFDRVHAEHGVEALQVASEPAVDLIVADIDLHHGRVEPCVLRNMVCIRTDSSSAMTTCVISSGFCLFGCVWRRTP